MSKKTVFIDRDGVINKDPGHWTKYNYVTSWEEFKFLPGSKEALKKLKDNGFNVILVSNQAGISKGYYTTKELDLVTKRMLEEIEASGGHIKKVYYCVHQDSDDCDCRKPKAGLFEMAEKEFGIVAKGSYFIGDNKTDIIAGEEKGLKTILVLTGKSSLESLKNWDKKPGYIFDNLLEAVKFILREQK